MTIPQSRQTVRLVYHFHFKNNSNLVATTIIMTVVATNNQRKKNIYKKRILNGEEGFC